MALGILVFCKPQHSEWICGWQDRERRKTWLWARKHLNLFLGTSETAIESTSVARSPTPWCLSSRGLVHSIVKDPHHLCWPAGLADSLSFEQGSCCNKVGQRLYFFCISTSLEEGIEVTTKRFKDQTFVVSIISLQSNYPSNLASFTVSLHVCAHTKTLDCHDHKPSCAQSTDRCHSKFTEEQWDVAFTLSST